jgi:hypothetical protein
VLLRDPHVTEPTLIAPGVPPWAHENSFDSEETANASDRLWIGTDTAAHFAVGLGSSTYRRSISIATCSARRTPSFAWSAVPRLRATANPV